MYYKFEKNRSMIFNPLIIVASELGIRDFSTEPPKAKEQIKAMIKAFRNVNDSGIGSVIVDGVSDEQVTELQSNGAYTVKTDMSEFGKDHNYSSKSGAGRHSGNS